MTVMCKMFALYYGAKVIFCKTSDRQHPKPYQFVNEDNDELELSRLFHNILIYDIGMFPSLHIVMDKNWLYVARNCQFGYNVFLAGNYSLVSLPSTAFEEYKVRLC